MYYHIPNETAFNGDEQVKKLLINALTPKAWVRTFIDEVPDNIAPLFSLSFDEGSTKELYRFYGLHYPLWCLIVFLYHRLENKQGRTWLLTLLKSIKPGVSLRDINFEYLKWATLRTDLKAGPFSAEDVEDSQLTQKIIFEQNPDALVHPAAGLVLWANKAMGAKAEWVKTKDKQEIARMLVAGGIVGCRLTRLCTPAELTERLLTMVKEAR